MTNISETLSSLSMASDIFVHKSVLNYELIFLFFASLVQFLSIIGIMVSIIRQIIYIKKKEPACDRVRLIKRNFFLSKIFGLLALGIGCARIYVGFLCWNENFSLNLNQNINATIIGVWYVCIPAIIGLLILIISEIQRAFALRFLSSELYCHHDPP